MTSLRLIHFADLHLGIELHGSPDPATGLSTRVQDFLLVFDAVIDYAVSERVDAVLFAGDAFKNRDPNPTLQRAFAERIRRLTEAGIPTVLLVGNHDLPIAQARATPMDIYQALGIPGIYVARDIRRLLVPLRQGQLQVVTLPWIPLNRSLANDEIRSLEREEIERRFRLAVSLKVQEVLKELDSETPAVFLGHVSLEGARVGGERSIMLGLDPFFSTVELGLHDSPLDYVALGHIHRHQVVAGRPPVVYAGSLERVDFGEEDEPKGFVVVEIGSGPYPERQVNWEFRPVPARRFHTIRIKVARDEPMASIERAIERHARAISGAIVRVLLELEPEQADLIRLNEVRRALHEHGAAYVAAIVRETDRITRPRVDIQPDEATDPVAMLRRWVDLRDLPDDRKRQIIERGRELIQRAQESGAVSS